MWGAPNRDMLLLATLQYYRKFTYAKKIIQIDLEVLPSTCVSNIVIGLGKHQVWLIQQQKCFVICIVQVPANIDAKNVCIQKKLFQQRSKMQRNQILGQTFSKVMNRYSIYYRLCLVYFLQYLFCSQGPPKLQILNFHKI